MSGSRTVLKMFQRGLSVVVVGELFLSCLTGNERVVKFLDFSRHFMIKKVVEDKKNLFARVENRIVKGNGILTS